MKKILAILMFLPVFAGITSCDQELLETAPTEKVDGPTIFANINSAQVAMDGVYRLLFVSGWTDGNTHQNFGILSTNMFTSLMGEDFLQDQIGNGWFYFDYRYDVRSRFTSTNWRSYGTWNFYYTLINNVNYIIPQKETIIGDPVLVDNLIAQALTIRAYSYFQLIQIFQQTYKGHESFPGVPIYTEPTTAQSEGKGRGTVQEVYDQINKDLDDAIAMFAKDKSLQTHKSHVDYYIANAIKARVCLVMNKWDDAVKYSSEALTKPGLTMVSSEAELFSGFNNRNMTGVMWGSEVIADQSTIYASFYSHMDSEASGMYGAGSRKCIYNWLYDQIPETDVRKQWWNGKLPDAQVKSSGPNQSYNQFKYRFSDKAKYLGDYIYMRAEEMVLVKAEALAHAGKFDEAKTTLESLMKLRNPSGYADQLASLTNSAAISFTSFGATTTLMDMILLQRRIELWGESERIFDILRQKTGFDRNAPNSNHSQKLNFDTRQPDSKEFILTIPQKEFDGNPNLDATADQNPI